MNPLIKISNWWSQLFPQQCEVKEPRTVFHTCIKCNNCGDKEWRTFPLGTILQGKVFNCDNCEVKFRL